MPQFLLLLFSLSWQLLMSSWRIVVISQVAKTPWTRLFLLARGCKKTNDQSYTLRKQWAVTLKFQAQCKTISSSYSHSKLHHTHKLICKVSPLYLSSVQKVISMKSSSMHLPQAVTKSWCNGECLKQAVHLALGCTCPFSAPAGPCPQLAPPLLTLRGDRQQQQSQVLCSTVQDESFFCMLLFI